VTAEKTKELYRRWLFGVWCGDLAATKEIFSPDFVGHWPGQDVHGPDGVAEQVGMSLRMFSDIRNTLDVGPIVEGDTVAALWTFHGTYMGGIPGATVPAGAPVAFSGSDVMRAENGRFVEYWTVSDALGLMKRLGVAAL
jgi:predicted ester cyclase